MPTGSPGTRRRVPHQGPWASYDVQVQVALTGPPRVVLGRPVVDLVLPGETCTLEELLKALAAAEPRIARYLRRQEDFPAAPIRPLLRDQPLDPGARIPDGAVVTLLYAIAGGSL